MEELSVSERLGDLELRQTLTAPERFLVTPGHVQPEVEHVVEKHRVYWVVEKFGEAAEVAEQTDPRSGNGVPPQR